MVNKYQVLLLWLLSLLISASWSSRYHSPCFTKIEPELWEVKYPAPGDIASEWQSWNADPCLLAYCSPSRIYYFSDSSILIFFSIKVEGENMYLVKYFQLNSIWESGLDTSKSPTI